MSIPETYLPILIMTGMGITMGLTFTLLGILFGPKVRNKVKEMPFECGNPSEGLGNEPFNVKFYMTAMIFLIFDVEIIFLYPWAARFRDLGWFGFWEVMVFIGIFLLAYAYVWKKGALEWD